MNNILAVPYEVWFVTFLVVCFKLKSNTNWNPVSVISTVLITILAGVLLSNPFCHVLSLNPETWLLPVAILISLTAERALTVAQNISEETDFISDLFKFIISKRIDAGDKKKDGNDGSAS